MSTQIQGRHFMLGFAAVILVVAVIGFFGLRNAADRRFAISIHSIPESAQSDLLAIGTPIRVRIDKRSAGHSPYQASAMLLDGNGHLLQGLSPLAVRDLQNGKRTEEVTFPPLLTLPDQRLLAAIVVRLPPDKVDDGTRRVQAVIDKSAQRQPAPSLPGVFGSILTLSRELGGHAELTQVEVREKR